LRRKSDSPAIQFLLSLELLIRKKTRHILY